jgi:hypothetical protein
MGISGLREKMQKGGLQAGDYQFQNTRYEMIESKTSPGTENAWALVDFVDADGTEYKDTRFMCMGGAGRGTRLAVNDSGALIVVNEQGDEVDADGGLSLNTGWGKFLNTLEDAGFSKKKLDVIGDKAGVVDGQWVHIERKETSRKNEQTGQAYTELVVTALLDEEEVGASKPKVKKAAAKKPAKAAAEEEEADDTDDTDDAEDTDDPTRAEAVTLMKTILSDLPEAIKNFNPKKNAGGVSVRELHTAGFALYKGKNKGPVTKFLSLPEFHSENAEAGLYRFDDENGIITPKKKKAAEE